MREPTKITTIALGDPRAGEALEQLAKIGKGKFRLVEIGKGPVENPGKENKENKEKDKKKKNKK